MNSLHLVMDGDGAWPELNDGRTVHHLGNGANIELAGLAHGMDSGLPSIAFRFDLPDGSSVLAETSLRLFLTAADAFKAKFGDPR